MKVPQTRRQNVLRNKQNKSRETRHVSRDLFFTLHSPRHSQSVYFRNINHNRTLEHSKVLLISERKLFGIKRQMHTSVLMGWKRLPHMERLLYLHCGNSKSDNGQEGTAITVFHKADLIQTDNQTSSVFRTTVRQIVLRFCKNCSRVHQEKSGNKITPAVRKRNEGLTGEYKCMTGVLMADSG